VGFRQLWQLTFVLLAASATGGCPCDRTEIEADIPPERMELGAPGEPLALRFSGESSLRFVSILVRLRLIGEATVVATIPEGAANGNRLPANTAELSREEPEVVISPCIEASPRNTPDDPECPETFDLVLDVAAVEAASSPQIEIEVLTTAASSGCATKKAAYAAFERVASD
jgi:hypothetical protein